MGQNTKSLNVRLVVPKTKQDLDQYITSLSGYFGTIMSVMEKFGSNDINDSEFAGTSEPVVASTDTLLHNPSEVDIGFIHEAVQRAIKSIDVHSVTPLEMSIDEYISLCERNLDVNDPLRVYSSITHHVLTGDEIEAACGYQTAIAIVDLK